MPPKNRHKSIREQCDHCRHFTGIGSDDKRNRVERALADIDTKPTGRGWCAVMVNYNDVMKRGPRSISLPCFKDERDNMPADGWPTCAKQSFKTGAELDAEAAEIAEHSRRFMERVTIVRPAILKHAGWTVDPRDNDEIPLGERGVKREGKVGSFDCPVCKTGKLRYSISGYNGHVHAHCTTADCVSWME